MTKTPCRGNLLPPWQERLCETHLAIILLDAMRWCPLTKLQTNDSFVYPVCTGGSRDLAPATCVSDTTGAVGEEPATHETSAACLDSEDVVGVPSGSQPLSQNN